MVCTQVLCPLQRSHTLHYAHLLAVEFGLITTPNNLQETGHFLLVLKNPVKILQEQLSSGGKAEEDMLRCAGTYVTLYITPLVALFLMDFSASFDFPNLQTNRRTVRTTSSSSARVHCRLQMWHSVKNASDLRSGCTVPVCEGEA